MQEAEERARLRDNDDGSLAEEDEEEDRRELTVLLQRVRETDRKRGKKYSVDRALV